MRKSVVKNKYNLTYSGVKKLKVGNRELVNSHLFWRNEIIKAWCITGYTGNNSFYRGENEYWIGIYDEDAPFFAGQFRFELTSYGGMCGYTFNKFFDKEDIECGDDLLIQEMFLNKINQLIDLGILIKGGSNVRDRKIR